MEQPGEHTHADTQHLLWECRAHAQAFFFSPLLEVVIPLSAFSLWLEADVLGSILCNYSVLSHCVVVLGWTIVDVVHVLDLLS